LNYLSSSSVAESIYVGAVASSAVALAAVALAAVAFSTKELVMAALGAAAFVSELPALDGSGRGGGGRYMGVVLLNKYILIKYFPGIHLGLKRKQVFLFSRKALNKRK
jgi:hypothetical protein